MSSQPDSDDTECNKHNLVGGKANPKDMATDSATDRATDQDQGTNDTNSVKRSSTITEQIAWNNRIRSAKQIYEKSGQAPSPSKDYCQILVTAKGVVWRVWNITLRNTSRGWFPRPTEDIMTHEDFEYDKTLHQQLEIIFGPHCVEDIRRAIHSPSDPFSCLPVHLSVSILSYLDLQSINNLARCSRHFKDLCNSDTLWERLYTIYQGVPNDDVRMVAKSIGWKRLYFMSKLQIQKEISRIRKKPPVPVSSNDPKTFLTQNVED